ncbi:jerky-like protein [Trichonephila clavipes]|nr:jerky-like protein [Trichonephila clavipes]
MKRDVLNIGTELEILNRLVKGESGASLARFYNAGKSTISDIKKSRETILSFASELDSEDGSNERKIDGAFSAFKTAMEWYEQQLRGLSYSTTATQDNQIPCSEKTKVYNGTAKNK